MALPARRGGLLSAWDGAPSRARRAAGILLVAAALVFLGLAIARQWEQLRAFPWELRPFRLAFSALVHVGVLGFGVAIWGYALRQLQHRLPYRQLARVWFLSNLARYIPGKVWQFIGLAEMLRRERVPAIAGLTSIVVYMGFALLSAWLVGVYLVPADALGPFAQVLPAARVLSPLLVVLVHPRILSGAIRVVGRLTRRPLMDWSGGWRSSLALLGATILLWLGFGAAFLLFVGGIVSAPGLGYARLTAVFALSFLAGYAVVIAPAGLGAKEGAMTALLASLLPISVAAAVALATRLWTMLAEGILALWLLRPQRSGIEVAE